MHRLIALVSTALACTGPAAASDSGSETHDDSGPEAAIDLRDGEVDLMPLGDSITLGVNGGYRNDLYTRLVNDGYDVDMVGSLHDEYTAVDDRDHEGHSGFSIMAIRDQIDAWLAVDPDVVLLMIGTNDIAWWTAEEMTTVADRLEELVDHILDSRAGIFIVLGTIAPLSSMAVEPLGRDRAELAVEYNAIVRERFGARSSLRVADINAVLSVDELYDGVHPNEAGHADIAAAWYGALGPLLR